MHLKSPIDCFVLTLTTKTAPVSVGVKIFYIKTEMNTQS